jgi:hypothetical protein
LAGLPARRLLEPLVGSVIAQAGAQPENDSELSTPVFAVPSSIPLTVELQGQSTTPVMTAEDVVPETGPLYGVPVPVVMIVARAEAAVAATSSTERATIREMWATRFTVCRSYERATFSAIPQKRELVALSDERDAAW